MHRPGYNIYSWKALLLVRPLLINDATPASRADWFS